MFRENLFHFELIAAFVSRTNARVIGIPEKLVSLNLVGFFAGCFRNEFVISRTEPNQAYW